MTRHRYRSAWAMLVLVSLTSAGCRLHRPDIVPTRMLEPVFADVPAAGHNTATAIDVRLLDTLARGHVGRRLLHQRPDGELLEDSVWRWSSTPDEYLDTALRREFAANPDVRLVDTADVAELGVTLLKWQIEEGAEKRLRGEASLQLIGRDRVVRTRVVSDSEPVSGELPGNLAVAAGRLLRRLAEATTKRVTAELSGPS